MELEPNRKLFLEHLSFIRHVALAVAGSPWPLDVPYYLTTYPQRKLLNEVLTEPGLLTGAG